MIQVHYAKVSSYDAAKLRIALDAALSPVIAEYGGVSGKSVMIKPNFLEWKGDGDLTCVNPLLLVQVCRYLRDHGASRIAVIENPAVRLVPAILKDMGIADELAALNVEMANCSDYRFIDLPDTCVFRRMEIAQEYKGFDLLLDFCKAKTHCMMTLTLGVKNLFGLIRGSERLGWHLAVGQDYGRFADMLLDIWRVATPQITLLDAVVGMEGNGPASGTAVELGYLAASSNAVALDAAVSPRMGCDDTPLVRRAAERGLIPEFEECGDVPGITRVELPAPPTPQLEWGVYFPKFMRQWLRRNMVAHPKVDPKRCIGCGRCAKMCPPQSLKIVNGKPKFKLSNCIRCYCCQEHCPCGAIISEKNWLMRVADRLEALIRRIMH